MVSISDSPSDICGERGFCRAGMEGKTSRGEAKEVRYGLRVIVGPVCETVGIKSEELAKVAREENVERCRGLFMVVASRLFRGQ